MFDYQILNPDQYCWYKEGLNVIGLMYICRICRICACAYILIFRNITKKTGKVLKQKRSGLNEGKSYCYPFITKVTEV